MSHQIFHQILTWTVKIKTLMEEETTRRRWDKSTSKRLGMAVLMWLVLYSSYILRTVLGTWQQIYAVTKVMMMREALLWNLKYYLLVVNHGFAMHNAQCTGKAERESSMPSNPFKILLDRWEWQVGGCAGGQASVKASMHTVSPALKVKG